MKNLKTTISGLIVAVLIAVQPIVENGNIDIKRDWQKLGVAVGITLFSYFAKDKEREPTKE